MATNHHRSDELPVEALLGALRTAAERDGVEDVDAVVAQFATFIRAQAPRLATQRGPTRWTPSLTGMISGAAVAAAAAGFVVIGTGVAANPFDNSSGSDSAEAASTTPFWTDPAAPVIAVPHPPDANKVVPEAVVAARAARVSTQFTDPDALAVVAEMRVEQAAAGVGVDADADIDEDVVVSQSPTDLVPATTEVTPTSLVPTTTGESVIDG